jgi:hypothetical protein
LTPYERSVHALRTLARFGLVQAGVEVAEATRLANLEYQYVASSTHSCEAGASAIRAAMARSPMNPELVRAMQRSYRSHSQILQQALGRLAVARRREEQTRSVLAALRNREHSLEDILRAQRRKSRVKQERLDMLVADDLWIQNAWSNNR